MKIEARRIDAVLRDPAGFGAILLFGEDRGLIRERAERAVISIAGSLDDPFRVAVLDAPDPHRLAEEATALALGGGSRVVRVRDAADGLAAALAAVLEQGKSSALVIEAPALAPRSKLRLLAEGRADVAAIACYAEEGATLAATIRGRLAGHDVTLSADALSFLTTVLGGDRAATLSELDKLALYAGQGGKVTLEDAESAIGDTASVEVEDALFAATAADAAAAERALSLAIAEGAQGVQIIRMALNHLQRLLRARLLIAQGQSAEAAMKALRPPVFFRQADAFGRALGRFSATSLMALGNRLLALEFACKQNGARDETLGRHAVVLMLRAARAKK